MKIFLIIQFFIIFLFEVNSSNAQASTQKELKNYLDNKWKLTKTQEKYLQNGKVLSLAKVDSNEQKQSFSLKAVALHKRGCKKVLRKLSRLENYKNWISFIKSSEYLERSHLFTLKADHPLLPYAMVVHIIVERPTKPGKYPFTFPTGMFTGLQGYFEITEFDKKCFFYAQSHWSGKPTKLPDFAIEVFSETLSKLGGEILMRKTR